MTPLQRIAMGLVIVLVPAYFPRDPDPAWAFYDVVADPVGWALALTGLWALVRAQAAPDLAWSIDGAKWLGVVAFVVSVVLWPPQINHLLVPAYNADLDTSFQWFLGLPQTLFSLFLVRALSAAGREHGDRFVAGRFQVMSTLFVLNLVLPVIVFGADLEPLQTPTLILVGLVNIALIYYLFRAHDRPWLGAPPARPTPAP